jgi:S1-C subfamily serine protease
MLTAVRSTLALAVLLVGFAAYAADDPLSKEEVAKLGKASTALVVVKPAKGYGSAFCVHSSGLFVTNQHVVSGGAVDLVLDPGLKTEKVLAGKVVREDKELDLALVSVEGAKDLAALALGSDEKLTELTEVIAFGFPFGANLAPDKKEYPAVSINAGSITALRRKDGELHRIQVDAVLNPGNSGGPVLDRNGKVIGVVVAGVRGAGVNFVIPVSHVTRFLAKPELQATPPEVTAANVHKDALFQAKAAFVVPTDKAELELVLKGPDGKERKHKMELVDGSYRATVVPVPAPEGPQPLRVTVVFADGSVTGSVNDLDLKVGATSMKLSDVRRVRMKPAKVELHDGKTVDGAVSIDKLRVHLGGQDVTLGLADADEVRCEPANAPESVSYTIIASVGGKEVASVGGKLRIAGLPQTDLPPIDTVKAPYHPPGSDSWITVAPLKQDKEERALPSAVEAVCHGGGGRFLILHLPKERKLAVFDVNEAKVVKYIPVAEDKIFFAAGMDKLFVLLPNANVIQRWDLMTFEKEKTVPSPMKGAVSGMIVGSASQGPLLVYGGTNTRGESYLIDAVSLTALPGDPPTGFGPGTAGRVSPDGRLFTSYIPDSSPQSHAFHLLLGNTIKRGGFERDADNSEVNGHVAPGPDGRYIFSAKGVFTAEGKPVGKVDGQGGHYCIAPAEGGGTFYLNLDLNKGANTLTLNIVGDARHVGDLDVEVPKEINTWDREKLPNDLRFLFVPSAKLLAVLPRTNDKLLLYRVDVDQMLDKVVRDYLLTTSTPPATFAKGAAYAYQVVVKSKKGGVKYKLDAGPKGMKIADDGKISWDVPANFDEEETAVILSISDASGQEIFHSFKISVVK